MAPFHQSFETWQREEVESPLRGCEIALPLEPNADENENCKHDSNLSGIMV
jgi:hypothetical protein